MKTLQSDRRPGGFTLLETLVVMALLLTLMMFGIPTLLTTLRAAKIRGIATAAASMMRVARMEAIRKFCPTVVRAVEGTPESPAWLEGFTDCNGDGIEDADKRPLGKVILPPNISLLAPPDLAGRDSIEGLSPDPAGGDLNVAIFQSDGSVRAIGGFRFADQSGNFLEVWVEPAATARTEVHKCVRCENAADRRDWYAMGQSGRSWEWK